MHIFSPVEWLKNYDLVLCHMNHYVDKICRKSIVIFYITKKTSTSTVVYVLRGIAKDNPYLRPYYSTFLSTYTYYWSYLYFQLRHDEKRLISLINLLSTVLIWTQFDCYHLQQMVVLMALHYVKRIPIYGNSLNIICDLKNHRLFICSQWHTFQNMSSCGIWSGCS